ncbi:MAG: hypothetical protein FWC28_04025, partial [Proteobacteria bacterium]|nr:hypothetical protein [Pseudomonadota bacterium]
MSLWTRVKVFFYGIRHTGLRRVGWVVVVVCGLLGWELAHTREGRAPKATRLTLLFKPGVEALEAERFLQALPLSPSHILLEPPHILAESQRILERLSHMPEGWEWPEEVGEMGWVAEVEWARLSTEEEGVLRGQLKEAGHIEEAYWGAPPLSPASVWTPLGQALWILFAVGVVGALVILSLNCLEEEGAHLKLLYELGLSLGQLRRLWFGQNLLWAVLAGAGAYIFWQAAAQWGALVGIEGGLVGIGGALAKWVFMGAAWGG